MKNPFLKIKELFFWTDNLLYKIPIIGQKLYLRQLVKFIISGGLLTLLDFAVYIFLTRVFLFWQIHYLWANFVSMSVGAVASFIVNKNWVFKNQGKNVASQYLKFWIIGGVGGMIFYQFLLYIFVETGNIYDLLGKALAAIIVLFFRFIIQKFWIFK
ncbi:MAG: GtrA family protein [Patescibacteria group bacterium]|jgi:putative flippase GtrA|nr:GtrA family protein [Patescibacteria group bacterium]MDD5172759.1 GtrA family protein [Patescibacteria group bacterium]